ncbi:MAG TPA: Fur family transcriptional regulator [Natronosporangium sp.]|nr:Fur family transcriptional regulator [Natronosporangium sp.]
MPETSLAQVLRSRGLRMTPQRQLVLEAVRRLEHATPEQVHELVRQQAKSVNLTTVYRSLELLEELGLVTHTHLGHGAPTYHLAGDHQHIHLVCRGCGMVEDVEPALMEPVAAQLRDRRGFQVDIAHVSLFGWCTSCAEERGSRS